MKKSQIIKAFLSFSTLFFVSLLIPKPVSAAGIFYFYPNNGTYAVGNTINVTVGVNTGGDTVNAVSAYVSYPSDLIDFSWIGTGGSVFGIWAEKTGGGGLVKLSAGATPPGVTGRGTIATIGFKVKKTGTVNLSFASGSHIVTQSGNSDILNLAGSGGTAYNLTAALPTQTQASPTATLLPTVSNIQVQNVDAKSVKISWETNTEADGVVEYGVKSGQYVMSSSQKNLTKIHSLTLNGLASGTKFYFRIRSRNNAGNETTSAEHNFSTPAISGVTAGSSNNNSSNINFLFPWLTGMATFILFIFIVVMLVIKFKERQPKSVIQQSFPAPIRPNNREDNPFAPG